MKNDIRTRFAPSPTGFLHVGGARTALFNYLFAKQNKGKFILRIEDTDKERSRPEFEKDIIDSLKWLGLAWDEFYKQSKRLDIYEEYLKKLLSENKIFYCYHLKEELEAEKNEQIAKKLPPRHICSHRNEKKSKEKGILRLRNDSKDKIIFNDLIRGKISVEAELLGDFSVAKTLREPLYNFVVAIDDTLMQITHIIRGEDHIPNTPKQLLIFEALGIKPPQYAHLPLILAKDRSKLSKRAGTVSIIEYKKQGYLPTALLNFLALLGWHPALSQKGRGKSLVEKEIFTIKELIQEFSLERAQKAGAVFDLDKLNWLNKEHIKKTDNKTLVDLVSPFLKQEWQKSPEYLEKIIELEKPRLIVLKDIADKVDFFFEEPKFEKELLQWNGKQDFKEIKEHLQKISELLASISENEFTKEKIEAEIMPYANEKGRGEVLWPLRVALSGKRESPEPFEIAGVLGKKTTLSHLDKSINL